MRKELIESYVTKLRASFGPVRTPIDEDALRAAFDARDYEQMVSCISLALCLDMRLFLALVNKGGPDAPAWIEIPEKLPLFGTLAFRQTIVTVYLRKAFLAESLFEEVVVAIAHEFSHVVLNATMHPLRFEEEAVDLTAMLLGFRDFYVTGCRTNRVMPPSPADLITGNRSVDIRINGYLSFEEVGYAAEYMTFR